MLEIAKYVRAESLEEAYDMNQKKGNVILGGMLWLKLQNRRVNTAIDLSGLSLDKIEEIPKDAPEVRTDNGVPGTPDGIRPGVEATESAQWPRCASLKSTRA